jgi:integrase
VKDAVRPLPSPRQPPGDGPAHCPVEEYAAFVASCSRGADRKTRLLRRHKRFVACFPDLAGWFDQPLRQRLGWRNQEAQQRRLGPGDGFGATTGWINFHAREYLIYLALTGWLRLDWGWLVGIGVLKPWWIADDLKLPLTAQIEQLRQHTADLGHAPDTNAHRVSWTIVRLVLHRGDPDLDNVTADDVEAMRDVVRILDQIPGIEDVLDPRRIPTIKKAWGTSVFCTGVTLFHAGITDRLPTRLATKPPPALSSKPRIAAVMARYLRERALTVRPETMSSTRGAMRRLGLWLEQRPEVRSLAELKRADLLEFMTWLQDQRKIKHPDQPLSNAYRRSIISEVTVFFRHAAHAEWPDVPSRPVLLNTDIPRSVQRIPRYIPEHQLEPIMTAIRQLECPLQRCALLVARWSGARRSEIRRLHLDCLDHYPDGTDRLRLAAGKSLRERTVPLHPDAAEAIRQVIELRRQHNDRGIYDRDLGQPVRYLFLHSGRLADADYLFARPLGQICDQLGILTGDGKPAIHAHRFRHTLGTQMAEKGARIQTIMRLLGHASAGMSMTYTNISDPVVLADYKAVLRPGAVVAGPLADTLRRGELDNSAINWLKTNFYKTELELGRCLRLPQEGPCECDLYLTCPKFITTPEYAPRLQERLRTEEALAADAAERNWPREVERHQCTADRIRSLLAELGESSEPPDEAP